MWEKIRKLDTELLLGGIFGIIAVIAIAMQINALNGTSDAIWGGVKDISTTLVAVMVLVVAIKNILPKKPKNFQSAMENEIESMTKKYAPLLTRATKAKEESFQNKLESNYRINLITDIERIFQAKGKDGDDALIERASYTQRLNTGIGTFVDFGKNHPKSAVFYINESTFDKVAKANNQNFDTTLTEIAGHISTQIANKYGNIFCNAISHQKGIQIDFLKKGGLDTPDDAKILRELIEFVFLLYIIKYQGN